MELLKVNQVISNSSMNTKKITLKGIRLALIELLLSCSFKLGLSHHTKVLILESLPLARGNDLRTRTEYRAL